MTLIEQILVLPRARRVSLPRLPLWGVIGIACALMALCGFAARGFSDNGIRLGSEFAWRFTFMIYFAAVIAGPLARLVPSQTLKRICRERLRLVWGFCTSFGVYLASILVPNTLSAPDRDGATAGMTIFVVFGTVLALVIAYSASRPAAQFLGERTSKAMVQVGMATFWLAFAGSALSHISGPHRPDLFYGFSLVLMVAALLLRFADCFVRKIEGIRGSR